MTPQRPQHDNAEDSFTLTVAVLLIFFRNLSLRWNLLKRIENIGCLESLTHLNLNDNQIEKIENLDTLINLEFLDVSYNRITKIEGLSGLKKLKELHLVHNKITIIEGLEENKSLEYLELGDNRIKKIDNLSHLSQLKRLFLGANQIRKIEGIEDLQQLVELSLPGNALQVIEGIDTLSGLRSLCLAQNGIRKMDGLGGLTSLFSLDLNDNIIEKLENVGQFKGVTHLMIRKNKFDSWKDLYQLQEIENLAALTMEMNPIYREKNNCILISKRIHFQVFIRIFRFKRFTHFEMGDTNISHPTFVHHDTGQILAIDCHPSGTKFITCGQKATTRNGLVVVWNMEAILDHSKATNDSIPKKLFQLDSQSQSNSCRWSHDGKRFAFASDDSTVSVWEYAGRINSAGSITGGQNIERYKEYCVLRSHRMEVLSVEWSPNGRYLATGSLDNRIIIYNAKKLPSQVTILSECEMSVKGLSWDPIGKYLASLEGDRRLRFWATDSWQCVTNVVEPFESGVEETVLSRMDWSPDGKYLMTPAANQKGQSLVRLIQRKTWKSQKFLAGHHKGTSCVRSLNHLTSVELKNGMRMQATCCAVGSRDKSISIWLFPGTIKPIFVIDHLFKGTIMDFAWCGRSLLVCSTDGTVKVITLPEEVIGTTLSNEAMSDLCQRVYSIRPPQFEPMGEDEENTQESSFSALDPTAATSNSNASFITGPEDLIMRRKQIEKTQPPPTATPKIMENSDGHEKKELEKKMMEERNKQVDVRKDGKRRIQPVFCGSTAASEDLPLEPPAAKKPAPPPPPPPAPASQKRAPPPVKDGEVDLEESSDSEDEDEEVDEEEEDEGDEEEIPKKRRGRKSLKTKEGTVLMEAPETQPKISQHVHERKGWFVEVDNHWKHAGHDTTQIRLVKRKEETLQGYTEVDVDGEERRSHVEVSWIAVLGTPVIIVTANKHYVMLGCGDKALRVYRTPCGSLHFTLRLDSLPVLIGMKENSAYTVTENGRLSTWNLKTKQGIVQKQALFDCVEASVDNSLISVDISSESAVPLIVFSNGSIFTFDVSLASWCQVITTNVLGRLATTISDGQLEMNSSSGPLVRLLKRMRRQTTAAGVAPPVVKAIKESQMEQLLNCAEQLGNPQDYKTILMLYVATLCEGGSEKKLKNVLSSLSRSGIPMNICGLRRSALCDDVTRLIKATQPAIADRIVAGSAAQGTAKTRSLF
uniref:Protein HIRA n=1 Tax=Caenorhabditis tropicalis TaxID=1561998 RepID=A0A1I7TWL8_9PELO